MQYILTEEEYRNFIPRDWYEKEREKIELLNTEVMELNAFICCKDDRSYTAFCDNCPIGIYGTNTCTESQQFSP